MPYHRLLVTGANGNLGFPLSRLAASRYKVLGTFLHDEAIGAGTSVQIDLREPYAVEALFDRFRPDAVIHAAGSDRSPDMVNTILESARNVSKAAAAHGIRLIVLSTDVIFDGTKAPYPEEALPTPVHEYGRAKAGAEHVVLQLHPMATCVRTSLIYDFHRRNRQLGWMLEQIEQGKKLQLFTDEFRQPIWSWNLAEALLELVGVEYHGILNIAGGDRLSRFEYGCHLLKAAGKEPNTWVEPALATSLAPDRPRDCTLTLDRARNLLKTHLLTIGEALDTSGHYSSDQPTSTTTRR